MYGRIFHDAQRPRATFRAVWGVVAMELIAGSIDKKGRKKQGEYASTYAAFTTRRRRRKRNIFIMRRQIRFPSTFPFHAPNLSSPKLPQPIFLPTRKLGPTMRTPDEEVEAFELLLCLVPVPPAPTAELDDCIVLTPANADANKKINKKTQTSERHVN